MKTMTSARELHAMKIANCAFVFAGAALAASLAAQAHAQNDGLLGAPGGADRSPALRGDGPNWYGEIGAGYVLEEAVDTVGAVARIGITTQAPDAVDPVFDLLAFEGELFLGVLKDDQEPDLDYAFIGAVRAIKEFTPSLDGFLRLGLSQAEVENEGDLDLLLGLGGELALNQRAGLRTDVSFQDDLETLSLTYTFDF